jgi:hypothetical protein
MTSKLLIAALLWCVATSPVMACYLIETKEAGEFRASVYWQEGTEIKFYLGDGVFGVSPSEIQRITKLFANGHNPCAGHHDAPTMEADAIDKVEAPKQEQVHAVQTAQVPPSAAYQNYEAEVAGIESRMHRLGFMATEDLIDLAKTSESLKKRMLDAPESSELRPLLARIYRALENVESMLVR